MSYLDLAVALLLTQAGRIKCLRDGKVKNPDCFSKNQINDLKIHIYKNASFNAATMGYISCAQCTGGPEHEFFCFDCDRWLPRDKFSKAQLKGPARDTAVSPGISPFITT